MLVVSVDATPDALEAVKQGLLVGTVAQYPDAMAYVAVETSVRNPAFRARLRIVAQALYRFSAAG